MAITLPSPVQLAFLGTALIVLGACGAQASDESVARPTSGETDFVEGSAVGTESAPRTTDAKTAPTSSEPTEVDSVARGDWLVVEVTDGDTVNVEDPAGTREDVRLIGINTPEEGECLYSEATDALAFLVADRHVDLVKDATNRDRYGRLLRYVEVGGVDAGAKMVESGYAIARRYEPDTARAERYSALETAAQEMEIGMWSPDACGGAVGGVEVTLRVEADAPGDDNDNLNGEWVEITNESPADLDLDGWQLADESASHRYDFTDTRLPAGATLTVFTGCGRDRELQRYWCNTESAVWNNSGDTAFLRDPSGSVIAFESYGDSA